MCKRFVGIVFVLFFAQVLTAQLPSVAQRQSELPALVRRQIARAHQGQREALQQLACEIEFGTPTVKHNGTAKLGSVGGWFSLNILSRMLSDDPAYTGGLGAYWATYAPLQFQALQVLPQTVADPPIPVTQRLSLGQTSSELQIWRDWLARSHDTLVKLEPTGEGIIPSKKLCKK